jgi:hypothetical protein
VSTAQAQATRLSQFARLTCHSALALLTEARVEAALQPVSQQIESEHGDEDRRARRGGEPRRLLYLLIPPSRIDPQLAVGGSMPMPSKLSAASTTMADATSSDVCTMIGAVTFGCGIGSSGLRERPVSECGKLRQGTDVHPGGERRRSMLMLPTLLQSRRERSACSSNRPARTCIEPQPTSASMACNSTNVGSTTPSLLPRRTVSPWRASQNTVHLSIGPDGFTPLTRYLAAVPTKLSRRALYHRSTTRFRTDRSRMIVAFCIFF